MKFNRYIGLTATLFLTANINAATVFIEDFEDAVVTYSTLTPEFSDGNGDFFIRTNGDEIGHQISYANKQGNSFFAAMDLDGSPGITPVNSILFSNIDIRGFSDLAFSGWFAEDDDGSKNDWDATDSVQITYQIDKQGFQNLLAFENDGRKTNSAPYVDEDFDEVGDGQELSDSFTEFLRPIHGQGTALDLRITIALNAGNEDIAFDNISVLGNKVVQVPAPASTWLFACGVMWLIRKRTNRTGQSQGPGHSSC